MAFKRDHVGTMLFILFFIFLLAMAIILVLANGCAGNRVPATIVTTPAPEVLTKIVMQTNWLATIGLLTVAAGVFAFINGNKAGTGLIGAGIALVGGVMAFASANELLRTWIPIAKWVVPALGLVAFGLWGYNHWYRSKQIANLNFVKDYLDKDKDGKVTAADIKAVLGIG